VLLDAPSPLVVARLAQARVLSAVFPHATALLDLFAREAA
jgi:hypothetical protein